MVVLGLILVLVAIVAAVILVYENSDTVVSIHAFGGEWRADAYWLAVLGAAVLVVLVLGLLLIQSGSRRGFRRRSERKQLERENAALAHQVNHTPPPPVVHDRPAAPEVDPPPTPR